MDKKDLSRGIFYMLLSSLGFSVMSGFIRLSGDLPTFEKSFFRNFISAIVSCTILIKTWKSLTVDFYQEGQPRSFRYELSRLVPKGTRLGLFFRCVFGTIGILTNYWAYTYIPLGDANMLSNTSPFFSIIVAIWILGDKPKRFDVLSILVAAVGTALIIKPGTGMFQAGSLVALVGGVAGGIAYTLLRKLTTQNVPGTLIVAAFSLFSSTVCLIPTLFHFVPMNLYQLTVLLIAGVLASLGQFMVTAAYHYAPPKSISIYNYSQVIFAAIFGYIVWREMPDALSIVGYVVIIGTAIISWNHQRNEV